MDCPFKTQEIWQVEHRTPMGGNQFAFTFPNGWGASVVRHRGSHGNREGKWELAVLGKDGCLNYCHPVSQGDVRGWLEVSDVDGLLAEIAATDPATEYRTRIECSPEQAFTGAIRALDNLADMYMGGDR